MEHPTTLGCDLSGTQHVDPCVAYIEEKTKRVRDKQVIYAVVQWKCCRRNGTVEELYIFKDEENDASNDLLYY